MILLNHAEDSLQKRNRLHSGELLKQFTYDYMNANLADLTRVVSAQIQDVKCHLIENAGAQGWTLHNGALNINALPETVRRLQANVSAFRWSNGVLTTPTVVGLVRTGIMDYIDDSDCEATIRQIGDALRKTDNRNAYGNIWGALHLLELQGWARRRGRDSDSIFYLTPLGQSFIGLVRQHWQTLLDVNGDIAAMRKYHSLCHNQRQEPQSIARFKNFVANSMDNWGVRIDSNDPLERMAARQLVDCLNGLVMGSAMVAMGMPVYEKQGVRMVQVGDSVLSHFLGYDEWVNWADVREDLNRDFIDTAFNWFERQKLVNCRDDAVRLSPLGHIQLTITPPLAALGVSYLKAYQHIDELLIGSGDPCGIDCDSHVDRLMNVYGSSGAGSGPASVTINEEIIKHYFNDLPLARQPAGIADIGCGDGTSLKRLADYIVQHTKRGKALPAYPLTLVGADYNDAPLELTRETLTAFDEIDGINTLVVKADISRPEAYNETLMVSGVLVRDSATGEERPLQLADLLHTCMFLIHNRRLCVESMEEARKIIDQAYASVGRERLRSAFVAYFGHTLPEREEAAFAKVLDTFDISFSGGNGLVSGIVAAADLIDFMLRWKPFAKHGLISLEGHSPSRYDDEEPINDATRLLRADQLPHPLNWGMHFQSRQFMMPFNQYMLAMALAGFRPYDDRIHGGINPPMLPSIDQLPEHRFFSIGCYVPDN